MNIHQFIAIIRDLPEDGIDEYRIPVTRTQRSHWLGWLSEYAGPGYYGRKGRNYDAKFVYNHVVCPELLIYLIRNIGLSNEVVRAAEEAYYSGTSMMATSGAIRKVVPWAMIYKLVVSNNKRVT